MLTQTTLREQLSYDPETGQWTWLRPLLRSKMQPGDIAGRIMDSGRRQIRIAGAFYYASRLAWLYMTGEWPQHEVDHINRNRSDDRWCNLREATRSQNCYNKESRGRRGIYCCGNQWSVNLGGRYFGLYRFIEEAIVVRDCMLVMLAGNFAPERATQ